jgi:ribosomal protein S18 acetylase RimI-like enzyme
MTSTNIIKATLNDLEKLQKIGKQTFVETFSAVNTAENMAKYLEENLSLGQLLSELNNSNAAFYFAVNNNDVIGYLKLNTGVAQTELKDNQSLEIERIYVLKEFHGKNIGQLLYEKAIQEAKKIHATYIWLGVWEENQRAINFYKKNGFVEFDKHIFILGDDEQTDIMMKLELVKQ